MSGWRAIPVVALLLAACAQADLGEPSPPTPAPLSTTAEPSHASARASESLDCNVIGTGAPPSDYLTVLDTIAIPDESKVTLQAVERPEVAGVGRYFSKAGLGIRAGQEWRLRVSDASAAHMRIGWGSPASMTFAVTPPRCGEQTSSPSEWLWYPGGFWTDEPGCYSVIFETRGRSGEVRIPAGVPCD